MNIGILKESPGENRVALLPDSASTLVKSKVRVLVESGAGKKAFASDEKYIEVGVEVLSREKVISMSDILVKIQAPGKSDLKLMKEGQILIAVLNPYINTGLVNDLAEKSITSFSLDVIPRITRAQSMDVLSSQATVTGYKAVFDAACRYSGFLPMLMTAAGTIKPAKVLVIGAGVAGLQAIATAKRLGAVVEAFDVRSAAKEEVMSLGARFVEVAGAKEDKSARGYAVEQTEEFKKKQREIVHDHAVKSDIIICTAQIPGKKAPVILLRETVEQMKSGSVVIDIAASSGGNCELTRNNEVVVHNQVMVVGNSNYPSGMPADASRMFGNNMVNFLKLLIGKEGSLNLDFDDEIIRGSCITHGNQIIHQGVRKLSIHNK
jgi:H+-translocating NAD(P) transhydrogenase subunit alpha